MPTRSNAASEPSRGPPHDGLIVMSQLERAERERVVALAARYRLPAVNPFRRYVAEGGLIAYGTDQVEPYREAADYVDRILNGERAIDLPVKAALKYENLSTLIKADDDPTVMTLAPQSRHAAIKAVDRDERGSAGHPIPIPSSSSQCLNRLSNGRAQHDDKEAHCATPRSMLGHWRIAKPTETR